MEDGKNDWPVYKDSLFPPSNEIILSATILRNSSLYLSNLNPTYNLKYLFRIKLQTQPRTCLSQLGTFLSRRWPQSIASRQFRVQDDVDSIAHFSTELLVVMGALGLSHISPMRQYSSLTGNQQRYLQDHSCRHPPSRRCLP